MKLFAVTILILSFALPCPAQDKPAGNLPEPAVNHGRFGRIIRWLKPSPPELLLLGARIASTINEVESSQSCFRASPLCAEGNPAIIGHHPNRVKSYGLYSTDWLVGYLFAHALYGEKDYPFIHYVGWLLPSAGEITWQTITARDNRRLTDRLTRHGAGFHRENWNR